MTLKSNYTFVLQTKRALFNRAMSFNGADDTPSTISDPVDISVQGYEHIKYRIGTQFYRRRDGTARAYFGSILLRESDGNYDQYAIVIKMGAKTPDLSHVLRIDLKIAVCDSLCVGDAKHAIH